MHVWNIRDLSKTDFPVYSSFCFTVNTHVHADHITGSGKLKTLLPGCKSVLSNQSGGKADVYVQDGEFIKIGESGKTPLVIECRATPGHTNGKWKVFKITNQIE